MPDILDQIRQLGIVPVIVIDDAEQAVPLADALTGGGIPCAEITFRTAAAAKALRRIAGERPDLLVGAGTVLTREQAIRAKDAGAKFMVSPGLSLPVVDYCQEHGIPIYPGVCTPTEVGLALDKGLRIVKFFPAEPMGGLPFLQAIAAPFSGVEFIPTGGISSSHLAGYLGHPRVVACGGSWMASQSMIAAGDFDAIGAEVTRAAEAVAAIRSTR